MTNCLCCASQLIKHEIKDHSENSDNLTVYNKPSHEELVKILKQEKDKQIKFTTNTAFLLNMWFPGDSIVFKKAKEFIEKAHENHWKNKAPSFIEVTFKIKKVKQ